MVNMIMRASGDETITMSRSFLMRKYSHCPLKKRPLQYVKEADFDNNDLSDDNSEPENLSTKPEDLRLLCKSRTPPSSIVAFTPIKKENEKSLNEEPALATSNIFTIDRTSIVAATGLRSVGRLFNRTSGGPLEPLSLNTPSIDYRFEPPTNASWPQSVPAHYPPHFMSLNYVHQPPPPLQHPSPVIQSDRLSSSYSYHCEWTRDQSPTRHAFTPFRSHIPTSSHPQQLPAESCVRRIQPRQPSPLFTSSSPLSANSPIYTAYHPNSIPPATVTVAEKSSNGDNKWTGDISDQTIIVSDNASKNASKTKGTTAPRYKCSLCTKLYSTFSGLSKHQQFHCDANEETALKKKFACKFCEKEYNTLGALKMHIRTHTLPCKCVHCGKAFSRPWLLQGHIRTHTGEKPFTCPHCSRAFADRSNLRAHLQTHSDVKKYSCTTCRKTFSRMSLLSKHIDGGCPGINTAVIRVTDNVK